MVSGGKLPDARTVKSACTERPVQRQHQRLRRPVDTQNLPPHQFQPVPAGAFDFIVQQCPHIGTEYLARDKGARVHGLPTGPQPIQEIIRPVVKSAHASGGDVQDVTGVARAIRQAAAKLAVALDQHKAGGRRAAAQQMQREQCAAETRPHDRDRCHALARPYWPE
jgi:hypothetical protein